MDHFSKYNIKEDQIKLSHDECGTQVTDNIPKHFHKIQRLVVGLHLTTTCFRCPAFRFETSESVSAR